MKEGRQKRDQTTASHTLQYDPSTALVVLGRRTSRRGLCWGTCVFTQTVITAVVRDVRFWLTSGRCPCLAFGFALVFIVEEQHVHHVLHATAKRTYSKRCGALGLQWAAWKRAARRNCRGHLFRGILRVSVSWCIGRHLATLRVIDPCHDTERKDPANYRSSCCVDC